MATSGEHPWSATGEDTGGWRTFRIPVEHSLGLGGRGNRYRDAVLDAHLLRESNRYTESAKGGRDAAGTSISRRGEIYAGLREPARRRCVGG